MIVSRNMRKAGKTKFRPEQVLIYDILKSHVPEGIYKRIFEMEKLVTYKTEFEDFRDAYLDIYAKIAEAKYAIRVMGPVHDMPIRTKKDELQKAYLEREGFKVIDVWYWQCPQVFKSNTKQLDMLSAANAYKELVPLFQDLLLPDNPTEDWLRKFPI